MIRCQWQNKSSKQVFTVQLFRVREFSFVVSRTREECLLADVSNPQTERVVPVDASNIQLRDEATHYSMMANDLHEWIAYNGPSREWVRKSSL